MLSSVNSRVDVHQASAHAGSAFAFLSSLRVQFTTQTNSRRSREDAGDWSDGIPSARNRPRMNLAPMVIFNRRDRGTACARAMTKDMCALRVGGGARR